MVEHDDTLGRLNESLPLQEKLSFVHDVLGKRYAFIDRIAVALYEPSSDLLKTFISSGVDGASPLQQYDARLADCPSLLQIKEAGRPRVVPDLALFAAGTAEHTRQIAAQGYLASYTLPMLLDAAFFGFLFYNSYQADPFDDSCLHDLDVFGHLISLMVINEISSIRTLLAALRQARDMTRHRDAETGAHIDRMARYARLIGQRLAASHSLDDEAIEHLFLFAPLHDLGKIAIADEILLKPGKLTDEERRVMQTHVARGRELVDSMEQHFGLGGLQHLDMLRNIVSCHHEALDGSGYPRGLTGDAIPLAARICTVADVFDAMTSARPYKEAWSVDRAFATLRRLAGSLFDRDCVEALIAERERVLEIQARYPEDDLG